MKGAKMASAGWLRGFLLFVAAALLMTQGAKAGAAQSGVTNQAIPSEVMAAYRRILAAIGKGDSRSIEAVVDAEALPFGVAVTATERPAERLEYGRDMNVPFLKHNFKGEIIGSSWASEESFEIETPTSTFWFVRTKTQGWKLYAYGDHPLM